MPSLLPHSCTRGAVTQAAAFAARAGTSSASGDGGRIMSPLQAMPWDTFSRSSSLASTCAAFLLHTLGMPMVADAGRHWSMLACLHTCVCWRHETAASTVDVSFTDPDDDASLSTPYLSDDGTAAAAAALSCHTGRTRRAPPRCAHGYVGAPGRANAPNGERMVAPSAHRG